LLFYLSLNTLFAQPDYEQLRLAMVNEQIVRRGIKDAATLKAMRTVPRHLFVPERMQSRAYNDGPMPIGFGQTISQPYIVAFMTQSSQLSKNLKVLEIGTGSGYQAAVLSEIVDSVFTIEIVEELGRQAEDRLSNLGYENVYVKRGDGYKGWPEVAPFDVIIVTAAPEEIPQPLIDQLKEGGRMVIPVGEENNSQKLMLITKNGDQLEKEFLLSVRFVPFTRN